MPRRHGRTVRRGGQFAGGGPGRLEVGLEDPASRARDGGDPGRGRERLLRGRRRGEGVQQAQVAAVVGGAVRGVAVGHGRAARARVAAAAGRGHDGPAPSGRGDEGRGQRVALAALAVWEAVGGDCWRDHTHALPEVLVGCPLPRSLLALGALPGQRGRGGGVGLTEGETGGGGCHVSHWRARVKLMGKGLGGAGRVDRRRRGRRRRGRGKGRAG